MAIEKRFASETYVVDATSQPISADSTNPYMAGDKVTFGGKTYVSTVDNNVWQPGAYGWDEV